VCVHVNICVFFFCKKKLAEYGTETARKMFSFFLMQERKAKHEIDHSYAFKCGSFYNCKMLFLVSSSFSLSVSPHLGGNLKEDVHR